MDFKNIVEPAAGAGLFKVTVPVLWLPPMTLVGLKLVDTRLIGLMVSIAGFDTPP